MATVLKAQQPTLRSFIVYDRLPAGCLAYPVTDEANAPHLRPGDIAIIDTADREPANGDLFVIDWQSGGSDIVETWSQRMQAGCGPNREIIDTVCWKVAGSNRARTAAGVMERMRAGRLVGWVDGPYATEGPNAGVLNRKLRGRVVGILQPAAAEPLRLISSEGR
ncbi:S24/S26 family peptidase [Sphingomonas sp. Leaf37]|uniref:S24/S26 family peptidase n=1 Tax=Sphingomonas sp. Leaf37 TaxID=2876552 RepID=UPI001E41EEAF|nr:S24/S26 family peptidase [Sphingomonas sp. Leaf37]